jgi:hypothetical protein
LWNLLVIFFLLYTSILVPVQIAFVDNSDQIMAYVVLNDLTDVVFGLDLLITFISSYETQAGLEECRFKQIALNYLAGWFFIDLLATLPTQLFQVDDTGQNRLARLGRLPRLYRLTKILRLIKVLKSLTYNRHVSKIMNRINLTSGRMRIAKSVLLAAFCVHIIACFWFMQAKFVGLDPTTWVYRKGYVDQSDIMNYTYSVYWAVQTLATVGYGEFSAGNIFEYSICLVWMMFGVSFYSFLVGSVTSILAAEARDTETLPAKLRQLEDYSRATGLDDDLAQKIRTFLLNNYTELFSKNDEHQLI